MRTRIAFVGLALLIAITAAIALSRWNRAVECESAALPDPPEALLMLTPSPHSYAGDVGKFAATSLVFQRLGAESREAFLNLANARALSPPVDDSWKEYPNTRAFNILLGDPLASEVFQELASSATVHGQLYGLSGLYLVNREKLAELVPEFADNSTPIELQVGCIPTPVRMSELIGQVGLLDKPRGIEFGLNITGGTIPLGLRRPHSPRQQPNSRIKLPVRPVTAVASATAAPGRPAAYAGRWPDDKTGRVL